ncbi:MAG TPA: squalene--hopene cyclase [Steroidobacteraceae bacterium]|nr:squalene--hopene cyclase [Steroidobacteraceae bacterium]
MSRPAPLPGSPLRPADVVEGEQAARELVHWNSIAALDQAIDAARDELMRRQSLDGCWQFELEADCTIPAEYIMMMHFLGEIDEPLQAKIAVYLRARQADHGGWPLYHGGDFNISCSVKAYFALKLAGDRPEEPHMARARAAILSHGGAAATNVFTRIALALFGQIPWRGVPYIPVETVLLPRWFPFSIQRISYWSRTVMVPLTMLCTLRPVARNPHGVQIAELFTVPPDEERHYFHRPLGRTTVLARVFLALDRLGHALDGLVPDTLRGYALRRAEGWVLERLNGESGLGAIFPAMVNALEAMVVRGYPPEDARRRTAARALEQLVVVDGASAYCQPCISPVWDTALAILAMQEEGCSSALAAASRGLEWLQPRQLLDAPGDWRERRPGLAGGGWPFQRANGHYPDLDDTAAVVWAMHRSGDRARYAPAVNRALDWLVGMQSSNGGFASFDVDNTAYYLNHIPFADHGALLDPPTSDVTARVVTVLALARRAQDAEALARALAWLREQQEADGSWFGRWGTNYVYGTWSVLTALAQAGIDSGDLAVRRAVAWLQSRQNADGGWGESNDSYSPGHATDRTASTPHQTAWALLGLLAGGEATSESVRRGVDYLLHTQQADGLWSDPSFTAPGFPRVFYLRYHGYCAYFPLWALAAYRRRARLGSLH